MGGTFIDEKVGQFAILVKLYSSGFISEVRRVWYHQLMMTKSEEKYNQ